MKIQVVTVSNRAPKEPYYVFDKFKESLRRMGVEPVILGWGESWGGLMTKPRKLRAFLRAEYFKGPDAADLLIVCDAWDVVFAATPEDIAERWNQLCSESGKRSPIVFNAERNCFPRGDLADEFPDPGTPWRFLNSGFAVGTPGSFLELLESMSLDTIPDDHKLPDGTWQNPNDQEHFMLAYLQQPVPMILDTKAEICLACHGSELSDFDFEGTRIVNLITRTNPAAFHFNGSGKNFPMPQVLEKLRL